ncbi:AI-2E family transporter [Acetobacter pasteurianus]|uniref:AI-2E family transporter n=1 Tax=Acetobacter pasteurianus TaxID=438 RepID=UPI003D107D04
MATGQPASTERIMRLLLLGGITYGCVLVLAPFSSALLWAGVLAYTTWPLFQHLRRRMGPNAASLTMTLLCAVGVVLPLAFLASACVSSGPRWARQVMAFVGTIHELPPLPHWIASLPAFGPDISHHWERWSRNISSVGDELRPYAGEIIQSLLEVLMRMANGALHLVMALFIAFFFWLSGPMLWDTVQAVMVRIAGHQAGRHLHIVGSTVRGTVYGILGTAIIQGILTGLGLWLLGVGEAVILGVLAAFLAVFPIGAPLVWIPAALWLFGMHHPGKGILLLLYGVLIISGADHLIRPLFIARGSKLPYLLTVLGVIGGLLAFGGVGIFLGPILLAIGFTLTTEFAADEAAQPLAQDEKRTLTS